MRNLVQRGNMILLHLINFREQMSEINQQIINSDLQNSLLNQSQILNPKQQTWSPNTLTQLTKKNRINSIKIVYPKQLTHSHQDRQMFSKSQTKKKVFDRHRVFTNRFKTQVCSKQSKQESIQPKPEVNDSLFYESQLSKKTNFKKNIFFDQIILSPKQRLETFRSHLKAVRQQNETYLKNKMNVIKQKIKRKIQKEPNQRTKGTFLSKKYEKTKDKNNEKQGKLLKIQKYDDLFEEDMIRKSIQIQKCQVLSYNSQNKLSFQEEEKIQQKNDEINKQKSCRNQQTFFQPKQQIHIKGENKIKINLNDNLPQKEQNYKMMIVNRLSPLRNIVSVIKPQKSLQKKKIDSGGLQVGLFFNIKALDQTLSAQTTSHKYSKSFDISLMKKIEKKLSQEATAHNFIKGSVIYRLLKERNQYKNRQMLTLEVQNSPKKIKADQKVTQVKKEVQKQQPIIQTTEVLQSPQKKKKVVVLSNKNITKYKSEYQGRIKYNQVKNKIDQNQQSFRSQLFQQEVQRKEQVSQF